MRVVCHVDIYDGKSVFLVVDDYACFRCEVDFDLQNRTRKTIAVLIFLCFSIVPYNAFEHYLSFLPIRNMYFDNSATKDIPNCFGPPKRLRFIVAYGIVLPIARILECTYLRAAKNSRLETTP